MMSHKEGERRKGRREETNTKKKMVQGKMEKVDSKESLYIERRALRSRLRLFTNRSDTVKEKKARKYFVRNYLNKNL
tara:strand:- start:117 stop:347 length:231 start_codon:yes stop_codon:yes gene_type:complete